MDFHKNWSYAEVSCIYLFIATTAISSLSVSIHVADKGLEQTLGTLATNSPQTASDHFTIAGLTFLRSVEKICNSFTQWSLILKI
jgi:hypothetical protein